MKSVIILSSHVFLPQRDSWEQSVPESVSQVEALCPDSLASAPPSMSSPEPPGSPSQYRSPSRSSSMGPSSHSYTLHSLEDTHYHSLTTSSSYQVPSTSFPCPAYMSSPVSDLVSKMVTEEASDSHASLAPEGEAHSCWPKEDGVSPWSPYEIRRAFWLWMDQWEVPDNKTVTSTSTWQYRENLYVGGSVAACVDQGAHITAWRETIINYLFWTWVSLCLICIYIYKELALWTWFKKKTTLSHLKPKTNCSPLNHTYHCTSSIIYPSSFWIVLKISALEKSTICL